MLDAGLSTQSIVNYAKVAKMVVASAVNSEGDQLYPRKWNHDFIGIPILRREEQLRQTITEAELTDVLANTTPRYSILFALLAGSGLRIGEALALKTQNLSPDCRVIRVRATLWNGQEQPPKTPNAAREVDVPELLAAHLRAHVANKSGYLFPTASGKPLGQRNALRALHSTGRKIGLHSFRRYRDLAASACSRGLDKAMARPFQRERHRLVRRGFAERLGVEAGLVRAGRAWFCATLGYECQTVGKSKSSVSQNKGNV
jgi:integrase